VVGALIGRARSSALARNTGWMALAQALRALLQAAYFVVIARLLGVQGLGQLAAALAIVFVLVPFGGLGAGNLLVLKVARAPEAYGAAFAYALRAVAATALVLIPLAAALGGLLLPDVPLRLVVALAVAELFFGRLNEVAGQAFQAFERLRWTGLLGLLAPAVRLGTVAAFALTATAPSAADWAVWYLAGAAICAVASVAVAVWRLGPPRRSGGFSIRDAKQGFLFSVGLFSSLVYGDIDKALLARLASLEIAGIYAAAYRVASFAFVPILALLAAAYARFFRYGAQGIAGSLAFARRLSRWSVAYGAAAGAVIYLAAPAVPWVLGADYAASVDIVRWLAPMPLLQSLGYLAGDALTGADRQGARSLVQIAAAALNVVLNVVLIPAYGWKGAAVATLVSLAFLAAALWCVALAAARGAHRPARRDTILDAAGAS
jgi:O-antigen/teichoic acid export membrane protein